MLEAYGYKNYSEFGEGKKRFAIWSGDENISYKEEIKSVFNRKQNLNGSKLLRYQQNPNLGELILFRSSLS